MVPETKNDGLDAYRKDLSIRNTRLSKEQEIELSKKILNGDLDAANELAEANLKFVYYVANKFAALCRTKGIEFSDIIAEGNLGLIKASRIFDYKRNVRFSTHAMWWIKSYIQHYIFRDSIVKVPEGKQRKSDWMYREIDRIKKLTGSKDEVGIEIKIKIFLIESNSILNVPSLPAPTRQFPLLSCTSQTI